MFPVNMPAAMMHLTVLASLLTVAVCNETTIFSQAKEELVTTTHASNFTSSLATTSTMNTSAVARQTQTTTTTTTTNSTTDVTSASPKSPRTDEATPSDTTANTTSSQAANGTISPEQTVLLTTESQNGAGSDAVNTSSPALSAKLGENDKWANNDLAGNPGLVAIICIFSIVLTLTMVVMMIKFIQSPRSNFERLEDMPLGKVTEESPFAHYSK